MKWIITVEATGPGPPEQVRIRRLLKVALRTFGLRCLSIGTAATDKGDHGAGLSEGRTCDATRQR